MPTTDQLNYVIQIFQIYFGMMTVITGLIGNLLNIVIFTSLQTFRETTCGFYLIVISIVNIGQIMLALFVRVISEGFKTNIRSYTWVCKTHTFAATWCFMVSLATLCLATIDQCISMSQFRQYSNQRFAKRAFLIICLIISLYSIVPLCFWDVSNGVCMIIDVGFRNFSTYFQYPILFGFLPLSTMIIFSSLAFYRIRLITRHQMPIVRLTRDRQLTAMTLSHAIYVICTIAPFIVGFIYTSVQLNLYVEEQARNNLIYTVTVLIEYSSFAGSFYIYCCASQRFRKQFFFVVTRLCCSQIGNNQIVPQMEMQQHFNCEIQSSHTNISLR